MINEYKKIKSFIIDILFPIKCIACNTEEEWLCRKCFKDIKLNEKSICPICEKNETPDGRTCFSCKKKSSLDGLIVTTSYKNTLIAQAIHFFKYRFIFDLHLPLAKLMTSSLQSSDVPICDFIIPIPLHSKRLRWRGFNQSELLAKYISQNLLPTEIILENQILSRIKNTKPQMKIGHFKERQYNIKNAFFISNPEKIKGKSILLVDDVATTGSTILECAQILKKNGAKEVFAIVIARQEIHSF
jgi:ComF family protein